MLKLLLVKILKSHTTIPLTKKRALVVIRFGITTKHTKQNLAVQNKAANK